MKGMQDRDAVWLLVGHNNFAIQTAKMLSSHLTRHAKKPTELPHLVHGRSYQRTRSDGRTPKARR